VGGVNGFGDVDPEDGWDASDPFADKVAILIRMVASITAEHATPSHNHARVLVRLGFATGAVESLRKHAHRRDRPILDALDLVFFYLINAEGVDGG